MAEGDFNQTSDEQLMLNVAQGDVSAFDKIYRRYNQRMLNYFYRMLGGDRQKAQDFLQNLFLKIIEKPHLFNINQSFANWIFTIANNMCKNEYRRLAVKNKYEPELQASTEKETYQTHDQIIDKKIDNNYFQEALMEKLAQIDWEHRSTFLLRFQEELSIREIHEITGCSEGTVKSRLFYTTKKLAALLKAYNPNIFEVKDKNEK